MKSPVITRHAVARSCERLGWHRTTAAARLGAAWYQSVRIPTRLFFELCGERYYGNRKGKPTFRAFGDAILICRGRRVVTVLKLDDDALAALLVWASTGMLEAA